MTFTVLAPCEVNLSALRVCTRSSCCGAVCDAVLAGFVSLHVVRITSSLTQCQPVPIFPGINPRSKTQREAPAELSVQSKPWCHVPEVDTAAWCGTWL